MNNYRYNQSHIKGLRGNFIKWIIFRDNEISFRMEALLMYWFYKWYVDIIYFVVITF